MDMTGFVVGVGSLIGGLLVVGSSAGPASVGNIVIGGFEEGVGADLGHVSSVAGTKSSYFGCIGDKRIKGLI
jgi:hypothetical protein